MKIKVTKKQKKAMDRPKNLAEEQIRHIHSAFREQLTEKQKKAMNRLLKLPEEDKRTLYNAFRDNFTMKDINKAVEGAQKKKYIAKYQIQNGDNKMEAIVPIEKKPLRNQIMDLIIKDESTSVNDILKTLTQCTSHIHNTIQVIEIIRQNDLSYDRFITNDSLELYFDLARPIDTRDVGYIAKGWDDPGFRLGDLINLEEQDESEQFKAYIANISRNCTSQGILMTVKEDGNGYIIQMEGLVYAEGFNKDTFNKTLEALMGCVKSARLLKSTFLGYANDLS